MAIILESILIAFVVGGLICVIGQLAMDLTPFSISTSHVLVSVLLIGEFLSFIGLYKPFLELAGMGAAVPLCGFGHTLMQGAIESMATNGILGILGGGLGAGSVGISVAVLFGYVAAILAKPKS